MTHRGRRYLSRVGLSVAATMAFGIGPARAQRIEPVEFSGDGHTAHGDWHADVSLTRGHWYPGMTIRADVALTFSDQHVASLAAAGIRADRLVLLVTAERTFDADGWMRLPSDERMSTLLTPTGLAIEGGVQGAATTRYGYPFKSPFDQLQVLPVAQVGEGAAGARVARFRVRAPLPRDLPPGLYRLRFDFGVMAGTRVYNFNGYSFAARPFSNEAGTACYFYSPVIPATGTHVSGRAVDGTAIHARIPWLLLSDYNSNGYRGVVADEDRQRFATSDRSLIPDEVILPMFDDSGNRLSYSLEPRFPADSIDAIQNLRWNWTSGELTVQIAGPDGSSVRLGTAPVVARTSNGPTTKNAAFTSWKPQAYGRYTVTTTGWVADQFGRRYEGGGTYRFWIARRMTLATATFQGMPYPIGSSYGRDIQFNPPFPADVQVSCSLFADSDPASVRTLAYSGRATTAGIFGAAQGMKPFPLNAAGEYHAQVLATYTDAEGHLWVSTMRHAGIVYPEPSGVIARGKKLSIGGKYVERGEKRFEGYVTPDGEQHLDHITFPYQAGDVLLIAAEGQGANKIEPVLTYQVAGDTSAWDTNLNGVGTTNLRIRTSNNYSPHLYPEYITDLEYYYGAAPRPGFMGRFIVGESTVRAPYWPVSPNSFGGQIGASANGDQPGDIYRLIGGVVLRRPGRSPMYSGYIASAFLLPKGTNNNRIVAAGSEDLHGPLGEKARFYLVGFRPGTALEVGGSFRPAIQIDPILPVSIHFELTYPDGRTQVADGVGDRFGSYAGPAAWPLDVPGVYVYRIRASWNGFEGRMPGLPESGGEFYVYSKTRPAGAAGLRIDGATTRVFSAATGVTITGSSSAASVHYALITPGAVIEVGDVEVRGGRFQYQFNPSAVHAKVPLYDIANVATGRPQIGRVIHLTFFAEERGAGSAPFFDFTRVILRGTTALTSRAALPVAPSAALAAGEPAGAPSASRPTPASSAKAGPIVVGATSVEAIRPWDREIDRMLRSGDLRVVSREEDPSVPGRVHERLQQFHEEVPVAGAELTRQSAGGATVSIFGLLRGDVAVETTPSIAAEAAREVAELAAGGGAVPGKPPTLVIVPLDEGGYALSWVVETRSDSGPRVCYVDAQTGAVTLTVGTEDAGTAGAGETAPWSRLLPWGEAGALRIAFADFAEVAGRTGRNTSAAAGGLRFAAGGTESGAGTARRIDDPLASGHPDHYRLRYVGTEDGGGVHANSTIASHAWHLAVEGGVNRSSSAEVAGVGEAGRESIVRLLARTARHLLPSGATFSTARAATIQSARDLFGEGSPAEGALVRAWAAVGVK